MLILSLLAIFASVSVNIVEGQACTKLPKIEFGEEDIGTWLTIYADSKFAEKYDCVQTEVEKVKDKFLFTTSGYIKKTGEYIKTINETFSTNVPLEIFGKRLTGPFQHVLTYLCDERNIVPDEAAVHSKGFKAKNDSDPVFPFMLGALKEAEEFLLQSQSKIRKLHSVSEDNCNVF